MLTTKYGTLYMPKKSNRQSLNDIEAWRAGLDDSYRKCLARIAEQLFQFYDQKDWAMWLFKFVNDYLLESVDQLHFPYDDEISAEEWGTQFLEAQLTYKSNFTKMNSEYGKYFFHALFHPDREQHREKDVFLPWLKMIKNIILAHCNNSWRLYHEYEPKPERDSEQSQPASPPTYEFLNDYESLNDLVSDTQTLIKETTKNECKSYRASKQFYDGFSQSLALITTNTPARSDVENSSASDETPEIDKPFSNSAQLLNLSLSAYLLSRAEKGRKKKEDKPKQFLFGFFQCCQYSYDSKIEAVYDLRDAILNGGGTIKLQEHLGALRNGNLGKAIRAFVKNGYADELLDSHDKIHTVRDFVAALETRHQKTSLTR